MGNPLRERQTASKWAAAGQVIELVEKVGKFDSLAAALEEDLAALDSAKMPQNWRDLPVTGTIQFGFLGTEKRVPAVTGTITADVDVVCQRCLTPFRLTLAVAPKLLLLESNESEAGYNEYEVWELNEQLLRPQDIVDELLVMALPFSAMHVNMSECRAFSSGTERAEEKTRPFAALREQMTQDN